MHFSVSYLGSLSRDLLFCPIPSSKLCPSDSPWLEQPEVQLLLQTVINVLLPPRIISTSRSKNFMLESSPAHCSTPGDAGKDLRREGLAESTSQAAYLGGCFLFSLSLYANILYIHVYLVMFHLDSKVFRRLLFQKTSKSKRVWFPSVKHLPKNKVLSYPRYLIYMVVFISVSGHVRKASALRMPPC